MLKHRLQVLGIQLTAAGTLIAAWQLATLDRAFSFAISSPLATATQVRTLFQEGSFLHALFVTGGEILFATLIGVPLAAFLGFTFALLPSRFDHFYDSFGQIALTTPQSVLLPVFMFVFGVGFTEIVIVGITHLIFVVILNARMAVKSIPNEIIRTSRFYGANGISMAKKVYIPYMAATLLQAVRLGFVFAITGVLVAQLYSAAGDGIGALIDNWSATDAKSQLTAAAVILTVFAVAINQVLFAVEHKYSKWLV